MAALQRDSLIVQNREWEALLVEQTQNLQQVLVDAKMLKLSLSLSKSPRKATGDKGVLGSFKGSHDA